MSYKCKRRDYLEGKNRESWWKKWIFDPVKTFITTQFSLLNIGIKRFDLQEQEVVIYLSSLLPLSIDIACFKY